MDSTRRLSARGEALPVLVALCLLTLFLGSLRGATRPFWFDEVSTAHIAEAPSWHEMLLRSRLVDLHPPLEPTLVRLSFEWLGPHEFAGHLPSVLAFTLTVGSLFLFLRRRTSTLYAALGALLPLCSADVSAYATEARPYGLLLGAVSVGVLAYDTLLRREHMAIARLCLALSLTAMLQAHLFGTFAAVAFFVAEAVRTFRSRHFDWWTWTAILLPWLSCVTYIPLLRIQGASSGSPMVYEPKNRTSLLKGLLFYHQFLYLPLAPLIKLMVVALLFVRLFPTCRFVRYFAFTPELATLLLLLFAAPLLVTLLLHVRAPESGFFPRYGIPAVLPAFLFLAAFVAWRAGDGMLLGQLLLAAVLIGCAFNFSDTYQSLRWVRHVGLLSPPPGVARTGGVETICPSLPLVMNDALQFLEADNRLGPGNMDRMVYLTDPAESLRLEHENATQAVAGMARVFETPHHVLPAGPFLATHPDFVLLVRHGHHEWLADSLVERHVPMFAVGEYLFAGKSSDLWIVSQSGNFPKPSVCPAASRGDTMPALP